ncbi:MAG: SdrD B-like domain-containing protein, partial [Lysobacterales bacterium]
QVCGFVDWNQDGDFADTRESTSVAVPAGVSGGTFTLSFGAVPAFGPLGQSYARVRLQNASTPCTPIGLVDAGEVEDYTATVLPGEMSLGNLVWQDRDNSGTVSSGEIPFPGIAVQLFRDADDDGTPDGPAIATETTDAAGVYRFDELVPDTYLVCINAPADWISSTGIGRPYAAAGPTEPAADPDNDINNNDDGTAGTPATSICSRGVTLEFQNEPTNDGDGDNNSNLSVDFGLLYNFDLALRKTLSPGQNPIVAANQLVDFTIEMFNQGTVVARNVVVTDSIPPGMILEDSNWTAGPGNTATRTLAGPLAPGTSIQTTIALRVTNMALPGELRNVAEISAAEDSQGQPVPLILDRDSDPDGNPDNDIEIDDEIGNAGGDEDDADPAIVILPATPIPAVNPLGLLLMMLMLAGLGLRRLQRS